LISLTAVGSPKLFGICCKRAQKVPEFGTYPRFQVFVVLVFRHPLLITVRCASAENGLEGSDGRPKISASLTVSSVKEKVPEVITTIDDGRAFFYALTSGANVPLQK
jgi:hypothetical protein